MIVSQALRTSTSRMALRVTFLVLDLAPSVATNLHNSCKSLQHRYDSAICQGTVDLPDGSDAIFAACQD